MTNFRRLLPTRAAEAPLASSFVKVLGVDAITRAIGILMLPVYLHLMTNEEYATFNYVIAVIGVISQVCSFGLFVPQSKMSHDAAPAEYGSLHFTINTLLVGLLAATLLPIYVAGFDRTIVRAFFSASIQYETYRDIILVGVITLVFAQIVGNYFLTRQMIGTVQGYTILRLTIGTVVTLSALKWITGDGAAIRLIAYIGAELGALMIFSKPYLRGIEARFSSQFARRSLLMALPIMGSAILGIAINFGDKFFLEKFCSLHDMSIYFLGLTLASTLSLVFASFKSVWLPGFLKEKNLAANLAATQQLLWRLSLAFGLFGSLVWLAAALALHWGFIKSSYMPVLNVLPVLIIANICSNLGSILSAYTVYWEMTYVTIGAGVVVAAASIPLNYLAAKHLGIMGIGATSVVVNLLYVILYFGFVRYRLKTLRFLQDSR